MSRSPRLAQPKARQPQQGCHNNGCSWKLSCVSGGCPCSCPLFFSATAEVKLRLGGAQPVELAGTAPSFSLRILYTCSNLLISSWGWPRIAPCSGSAKFCTPLCWQGQAGGILHFDLAFALDLNRDIRNAVRRPNSLEGSSGNVRPSSCFAGRAGLQHECEHAFEDRRMQCRTSVASSTALRGQRQRSTRRRVHVRVRVRVCAWVHACVWACGRVGVCACAVGGSVQGVRVGGCACAFAVWTSSPDFEAQVV